MTFKLIQDLKSLEFEIYEMMMIVLFVYFRI
jgi:hypothetical protein